MVYVEDQSLKNLSRVLRKNMTKEEKHLWYDFLKKLPYTVKRQKQFERYIVDFYCHEGRLVIELDGSQHYKEDARINDAERDAYLLELGLMVLRYSNYEVNTNFDGVCTDIMKHIRERVF